MTSPVTKTPLRIAGDRSRAMPARFRFTRAKLDAVNCPAGKRQHYVFDTECPGLAFLRSATGAGRFYFYKKIAGQPRRYPIADATVSVEDARKIARTELTEYAKGNDVRARRQADRKQFTLAELFTHWKSVEGAKKRSIGQYADVFNRYAAPLAGRRINSITHAEVARLHASVGENAGPYSANRTLAVLSILFRWAHNHIGVDNPVKGIKRFPEHSRERFLQPDELVKFYAAVESEPEPTWRDFWKLLIFTGARRDNVAGMAWADVDLIGRVWRIPAHSAKGKRLVSVPLSDDAAAVLQARRDARTASPWVFPSYSKSGRLTDPKAAWARLLARADLSDLRMHDIRRTVGSYMAMSGVSDRLIGSVLGQSTAQATNVYARLRTEPVRAAMAAGMAALNTARTAAEAEEKARQSNAGVSMTTAEGRKMPEADGRGKRAGRIQ